MSQARFKRHPQTHYRVRSFLALSFLLLSPMLIWAQQQQRPPGTGAATDPTNITNLLPLTITVNVREANGMMLEGHAFVKLSAQGRRFSQNQGTQDNSSAAFKDVPRGDYDVEVSAAGYKTAVEHLNVPTGSSDYPVFVYLHPESEDPVAAKPPAGMAMTPKLQNEMDKGMDKLRKQQFDSARQHLEKAAKIAPGNADVQYLLGRIESAQKHPEMARARYESALTLYPAHSRSLVALGEMQMETGDADGAVRTLEKAYAVNGADWRMHLLLAQAYDRRKDFAKAALHAARAAELNRDQAPLALMLLGRIHMEENKRAAAKQAFELLIKEFPSDPAVPQAKSQIAALAALPPDPAATAGEESQVVSLSLGARGTEGSAGRSTAAAAPLISLPDLPVTLEDNSWAPPEVDSKEYPLAQGVSCSQGEVLERAQARMLHQLQNFDKFMATERIEHRQVDARGNEGDVRSKDFSYLVFVHPFKKDSFFLEESRDGGMGVDAFPTNLATTGLVGLGVAILEREYESDFDYKCEGLSSWRGQAAWQIHFEQKKGVESRVRVWRRRGELFPVALKGRIWLAANSYDLLHMETDLRDPIEKLALVRDHLMIDYGPVTFERGSEKLWLPWRAEMFMQLHGRRYHHLHTLSNYMLFSVDTTNKIGKPKEVPEEDDKGESQQN